MPGTISPSRPVITDREVGNGLPAFANIIRKLKKLSIVLKITRIKA